MSTHAITCVSLPDCYKDNLEYLQDLERLISLYFERFIANTQFEVVPYTKNNSSKGDGNHPNSNKKIEQLINIENQITALKKEMERKVKVSLAQGIEIKLEELAKLYSLNEFEKLVLATLFFVETHPRMRKRIFAEMLKLNEERRSSLLIGDLIYLFAETPAEIYENRKYFSAEANFIKHALVRFPSYRDEHPNIMNLEITITQELMNFVLDDKNEYHSTSLYIEIENPTVSLDKVVLDEKTKEMVKCFIAHREEYQRAFQFYKLDGITGANPTTIFLFYGPSGTGKTMLAKAIANYLKKPLMTVDFKEFEESRSYFERGIPLKKIFQKAEMKDAVLLIDECDDLLQNSSNSRTLLIELEQTKAMVILATNEVRKLDPAIDRRISLKIKFTIPGFSLRKKLWEIHLPEKSLLAEEVDTDELARKFLFPGGFIKNAVLTAFHYALKRTPGRKPIITQNDLLHAALSVEEQMLQPLYYSNPQYPTETMDELKLSLEELAQVNGLLNVLKNSAKAEKPVRVLLCGSDLQYLERISRAIANFLNLPCNLLPTDLFYNDKCKFFLNAQLPHWFNYEYLLRTILRELCEMESILVLIDQNVDLFKVIEKKRRSIDLLFSHIQDIQKPSFILTNAVNLNFGLFQPYFDFIIPISSPETEVREACWKKLLLRGIPIASSVNVSDLANNFSLSESEIIRVIDMLIKRAYFSGAKEITQEQIEQVISELTRQQKGLQLFGNV